jgi:hypothetical protein
LQAAREELLDRERECERLQNELNHAKAFLEQLESGDY